MKYAGTGKSMSDVFLPVVRKNLLGQRGATCEQRRLDPQEIFPQETASSQKDEFRSMPGFGRCATEFPSELRETTDARTNTDKINRSLSLRERSLRSGENARRTSKVLPRCENRSTLAALHKTSQRGLLAYITRTLCLWSPAMGTVWATGCSLA